MNKSTRQYLADVKRALGISSNYALAKRLEISEQAVAYLSRGGVMSATTAAKVAELLQLPPLQVIADAELERGSAPDLWKRLRDAAVIAGAAIAAALLYRAASGGLDINGISTAFAALAVPVNWTELHIVQLSALVGAGALSVAALALATKVATTAKFARSYGL